MLRCRHPDSPVPVLLVADVSGSVRVYALKKSCMNQWDCVRRSPARSNVVAVPDWPRPTPNPGYDV